MTKKTFCPRCGSKKIKYEYIYEGAGTWKCHHCGYEGSIVIENGNLEKQLKEIKKMKMIERKLFRGR